MELLRRTLARVDRFQQRHAWASFPVAVIRKSADDQVGSLAASIAYYGFLGVFPLLLVFAAILGFVLSGHPEMQRSVLQAAERTFPALSGYVDETLVGSRAALGIGLAGALWAGMGVTLATERAMNTIWDIPQSERPSAWWSRLRGLLMLAILGLFFLASDALTGIRGGSGPIGFAGDSLALAGTVVLNLVLFGLAFFVLTNRDLSWRQILPGAAVGAVGWTLLQNLGALFVEHQVTHTSRLYGSIGVALALVVWIYLGARLIMYAAEVNVVIAYRLWPRSLHGAADTEADRRALLRQAEEAQRLAGELITVSFAQAALKPDMPAPPNSPGAAPATTPDGA